MENLYSVIEKEAFGEYCYVIKAETISEAFAKYILTKREERGNDINYTLELDEDESKRGILFDLFDDYELPGIKFFIKQITFGPDNVIFLGGYSE